MPVLSLRLKACQIFLFILLESRRGTMLTLSLFSCTMRDTQAHHLCHHNRASQHPKSEPFMDWQLTINSGMYPINWANTNCQPTELWANQRVLFKQLIFFLIQPNWYTSLSHFSKCSSRTVFRWCKLAWLSSSSDAPASNDVSARRTYPLIPSLATGSKGRAAILTLTPPSFPPTDKHIVQLGQNLSFTANNSG